MSAVIFLTKITEKRLCVPSASERLVKFNKVY